MHLRTLAAESPECPIGEDPWEHSNSGLQYSVTLAIHLSYSGRAAWQRGEHVSGIEKHGLSNGTSYLLSWTGSPPRLSFFVF